MSLVQRIRNVKRPSLQSAAVVAVLVLACVALLLEWWQVVRAVP